MNFLDFAASQTADLEPPVYRSIGVSLGESMGADRRAFFDPLAEDEPVTRSVMAMDLAPPAFGAGAAAVGKAAFDPQFDFDSQFSQVSQTAAGSKKLVLDLAPQPAAPQLPGAPFPVEAEHFYSELPLASLVGELERALASEGALANFNGDKVKFSCRAAAGSAACSVDFKVRVYATQGRHLVEFQRRAGGALQWRCLYGRLSAQLRSAASGGVCPQSPRKTAMGAGSAARSVPLGLSPALAPPTLERVGAAALAAAPKADVTPLLEMVATPGDCVRRAEAAAAVASLARDATTACALVEGGAVAALVRALAEGPAQGTDGDVVRACAAALANLGRASAAVGAVEGVTDALLRALGSVDVLAQREVARALSALAVVPLPAALPQDPVALAHLTRAAATATATAVC